MQRLSALLLGLTTVYGCATASSGPPAAEIQTKAAAVQTFVFECPEGFSFVARVEPDKAWLFLPGITIDLPRVPSASGAKFAADGYTFWSKGDEAMMDTGANSYKGCRNNRASAIWEHAKLSGVDFRATGNEPGWYLEISNKEDILLVTDYGNSRYRFNAATIKSDPHSRTTIYTARSGDDRVEITITGDPCRDSMSGESFAATVSVLLNESRFRGCGRALH